MMKKAILMLVVLLAMVLSFSPAHAGKNRTVTILFTGDLLGQITPRHS
ncbi:MAG TPA: hypothetical protein PLA74_01780 [Syntrophales bacterium]|nr:hypothetical protein [Syntrophales bacterium]HPQ43687.1 hypothetical protein [Syntrophales bacterium]